MTDEQDYAKAVTERGHQSATDTPEVSAPATDSATPDQAQAAPAPVTPEATTDPTPNSAPESATPTSAVALADPPEAPADSAATPAEPTPGAPESAASSEASADSAALPAEPTPDAPESAAPAEASADTTAAPGESTSDVSVESAASSEASADSAATPSAPIPGAPAGNAAPAVSAPAGSGPATPSAVPAPGASANAVAVSSSAVSATPAPPTPAAMNPTSDSGPAQHAPAPDAVAAIVHPPALTGGDEVPPPAVALDDPDKWGRVDAEGTVYVRTADGERAVGSWQAGEPVEGLAHFARRFDDIRTEVELLAARLASGSGDPKQSAASARHLKDGLAEAHVVGDLVGLAARIDYLIERAGVAVEQAKQARDVARGEAVARKQELVAEAEQIAEESTQWKAAGDRLRAILDEWKTIKGVDRKTDEQLWRRFAKARDTFSRRRGSHFADLDRQRSTAKVRKQELVDEAETLSESDDWGPTAGRFKDLMVEWKAAGRAPKDADDALWQRFRAAQDKFFSRRSAVFDERDAEFADNAKRKEELLAEAEKINVKGDLEGARNQLHRIQERWEQIGKVPRERIRELEGRLRAVEEKVRTAADAQWRRTDPEAEARAAQFRERVEQFEAQAAKARASGDKRRADQAEAQAAQWREWLAAAEQAVASR